MELKECNPQLLDNLDYVRDSMLQAAEILIERLESKEQDITEVQRGLHINAAVR